MTDKRNGQAKAGVIAAVIGAALLATVAAGTGVIRLGKQADGAFLVSSGQRVEAGAIAFDVRPVDMALHPSGTFAAVLGQNGVFRLNAEGVIPDSTVPLMAGAAYHGIVWTPDGKKCLVSTEAGIVRELLWDGTALTAGAKISCQQEGSDPKKNPRPGGMAVTKDGKTLFVALCDANAVAEIDLTTNKFVRSFPAQMLPFTVALSEDEKTLIVSNWGGREPKDGDAKGGNRRTR